MRPDLSGPGDEDLEGVDPALLVDDVPEPAPPAEEPSYEEDVSRPGGRTADVLRAQNRVSRAIAVEEEADDEIANTLRTFIQNEAGGVISIERRGPPGMPACEYGRVCDISCADVRSKSLEERVEAKCGGGEFRARFRRGDGALAAVAPVTFEIAGDPICKSRIGKAWLREAQRDGQETRTPESESDPMAKGSGAMTMILKFLGDQQQQRQFDADRERDERKLQRERELGEMAAQREAAKREADAAANKLKAEQEIALERMRKEEEARAASQQRMFDAQIEMMGRRAEAEIEGIKINGQIALERAKSELKTNERISEMKMTGGLGFEVLTEVKKGIAEMFLKSQEKTLGLEDAEDTGFLGTIGDILKENAPRLIEMGHELVTGKPAPAHVPELPAPEAPAVAVPTVDDPVAGVAIPHTDPAPAPVFGRAQADRAAAQIVMAQVVGFTRPLAALMRAGPDARAAWSMELSEDGRSLEDCFARMPKNCRLALASGWDPFLQLIAGMKDDHALLVGLAEDAERRAWIDELLACGPWVPDEEPAA